MAVRKKCNDVRTVLKSTVSFCAFVFSDKGFFCAEDVFDTSDDRYIRFFPPEPTSRLKFSETDRQKRVHYKTEKSYEGGT